MDRLGPRGGVIFCSALACGAPTRSLALLSCLVWSPPVSRPLACRFRVPSRGALGGSLGVVVILFAGSVTGAQ